MIPTRSASVGRLVHVVRRQEQRHALRRSSRNRSQTKSRAAGSSPVVGSSRKSTCGACMSARAIIIRCVWPPEKKSGFAPRALEQAELLEQLVGARLALARRDAVVGGVEDQVVAHRERAVEVAALRNDRELPARLDRVADDVDAADARAFRRSGERGSSGRRSSSSCRRRSGRAARTTSPCRTANETPSTAFTGELG